MTHHHHNIYSNKMKKKFYYIFYLSSLFFLIFFIINSCSLFPMSLEDFIKEKGIEGKGHIEVYRSGTKLSNGDTIDFGQVSTSSSLTIYFEVKNTGVGKLKVDGNSGIIGVNNPWTFYFLNYFYVDFEIEPNRSETFKITFAPDDTGVRNQEYLLIYSDADNNKKFRLNLLAEGI